MEDPRNLGPATCPQRYPINTRPGALVAGVGGWGWGGVGGGDSLPPLFWGWVWFPFCLLAFLAFRPGWGWVWGLPPLASQPGCRAVAKRLPNAHPVPGLPALLRHRGNCPGRGACLGSSVESSTRCSGLRRFPFFSSSTGPIATGSRRRRLVLKPSQKDALQALFQQNPYPGIATRERLARELGIDESRVQVGPPPLHPFSLSRLSMPIQGS